MTRLSVLLLSLLVICASPVYAASVVDSLPAIGTEDSVYPLPDPDIEGNESGVWITQSGVDYRINPLRLGYVFVGPQAPIAPYIYQLWWKTSVNPAWIYYYDGAHWIPFPNGAGCAISTVDAIGCVKPDGITITVDNEGTISTQTAGCSVATTINIGCVKPDDITITIDGDGVISAVAAGCPISTLSVIGCVRPDGTTITVDGSGILTAVVPTAANPTAIASEAAVNGTAPTFMRSDAAPAIQKTSASLYGVAKVDNVTITAVDGVISAVGGGGAGACDTTGVDGQVCNSLGVGGSEWGSRVIGAPGATDTVGDTATITGGLGDGTGDGGPVNITGGAGGASASGGGVTITGGASPNTGGDVTVTGGTSRAYVFITGGEGTDGDSSGGVWITGGSSTGNGAGGEVIILAGTSVGTGAPGYIEIGTQDAGSTSSLTGSSVDIHTAKGGDGLRSGEITVATADSDNQGDSGDITITTGAVDNPGNGSGNIEIRSGNSTAGSNGATGTIFITGGQPTAAAVPNNAGKILLDAWGATRIGSSVRAQALVFDDITLGGAGYFGFVNLAGWLTNEYSAPVDATTTKPFLINGKTTSVPLVNGVTTQSGGDLVILGGYAFEAATYTYAGHHSGNLYLGGGDTSSPTKFDYGNVVYKTAQADQSFQFASSGGSVTVSTGAGTLLLDGVNSTFTITLPRSPQNGRILHIATAGAVGTLTISPPGAETVTNAPAALTAGQGIAYIYRTANTSWYRLY